MDLLNIECVINGCLEQLGVTRQSQMTQKIDGSVNHRNGICDVLSGNGSSGISSCWFKDGVLELFENGNKLIQRIN